MKKLLKRKETTVFILAVILTLAVAPEAQRRGLGRAFLLAALDEAARRGAKSMFLEVSVTNEAASALYLSCGFTQVGRRRGYYAGGGDAPNGFLTIRGTRDDAGRHVTLRAGDRIVSHIPGGGGYGDPVERDRAMVASDLKNGLITPDHAKKFYKFVEA